MTFSLSKDDTWKISSFMHLTDSSWPLAALRGPRAASGQEESAKYGGSAVQLSKCSQQAKKLDAEARLQIIRIPLSTNETPT